MTRFDHILIIISIVISVGITTILAGFGALIELNRVKMYLPHTVWSAVTFALLVHFWWALWDYRGVPDEVWTYLDYVIVLLAGTFLYLMAELILPVASTNTPPLQQHFKNISVSYFLSFSIYLLLGLILRRRVRNISLSDRENFVRYFALATALGAFVTATLNIHDEWIDYAFAFVGVILLVFFILYFNPWRLSHLKDSQSSS